MRPIVITILFCLFTKISTVNIPDSAFTPEDYECMAELDLKKEQIETFFDDNYLVILGNPSMDTYSECWIRKMKLLNEKDEFDFFKFNKYVKSDLIDNLGKRKVENIEQLAFEVVENCKVVQGKNIGDLGSRIYNCVAEGLNNL